MKRIVTAAIILVAAFLVFRFSTGRTKHFANLPPSATGPWIAFGDSLTAGYGAEPNHDYPTVLGKRLGLDVKNAGIPGNTTRDGLNRIESVLKLHPRVVLLCFGGNDGLQGLPRDEMFSNLGQIIDQLHREGAFVVLIGIRSTTLRDKNNGGFKDLADQKHVLLIPDMLDGVLGKPSLMSDYVHPNDDGYSAIAERIHDQLRPYLSQLR